MVGEEGFWDEEGTAEALSEKEIYGGRGVTGQVIRREGPADWRIPSLAPP